MIYLYIFWLALIIFVLIYVIANVLRKREWTKFLNDIGGLLFIALLIPIMLIAIITHDPIYFGSFEIPTELQWLGSLFASFFGAWQFYLKPLKEKVINTESETRVIVASIKNMDENLRLIKNKFFENANMIRKKEK